ncbi:hypothetical protein [Streptomyces vinaceus]|uniref:hypothetical protein n=1 Tax=Streptomyces vinaceus TaxID=1960 RepID=UPI0038030D70
MNLTKSTITFAMVGAITVTSAAMNQAWADGIPEASPAADKGIIGTTVLDGGISLSEGTYTSSHYTTNGPQSNIPANGQDSWSVIKNTFATTYSLNVKYKVSIPDSKSHWVKAGIKVPPLGYNTVNCNFYDGDPDAGGKLANISPARCSWASYSGYDPQPVLKISRAAKITDPGQIGDALTKYCKDPGKNSCAFDPANLTEMLGPEKRVTEYQDNKTPDPYNHRFIWRHMETETTNFAVSAEVSVGIDKVVSAAVKTTYGKTWTHSKEYSSEPNPLIRPGWTVWVTYQPPLQKISGTFYVGDPKKTQAEEIEGVLTAPDLDNEGSMAIHACETIKLNKATGTCSSGETVTKIAIN